jgi:hypothetical protein
VGAVVAVLASLGLAVTALDWYLAVRQPVPLRRAQSRGEPFSGEGGQAGTPAPTVSGPIARAARGSGIILAVMAAAVVAACSPRATAPVKVSTPTYSATITTPARAAFILGYNDVASEHLRSLLGTPLVHGDPSSDATVKTLCAYEADQVYAKASVKNAAFAAGCRAALNGKPDAGQ